MVLDFSRKAWTVWLPWQTAQYPVVGLLAVSGLLGGEARRGVVEAWGFAADRPAAPLIVASEMGAPGKSGDDCVQTAVALHGWLSLGG
ncbi:MAG: hypothetical protein JNN08_14180 [Bryobacterales bacterium]|nr:hypothetical protein [Bryobacterales bacterium]